MASSHQGEQRTLAQITALVRDQVDPLVKILIDVSAMLAVYTEGRTIATTRTQALMALTEAYEAISKAKETL
jgi:hypothetical protein